MRARIIRVLVILAVLSAVTPWSVGDNESVAGLAETTGLLAALTATIGLVLHLANVRPGWIGPALAAAIMWREVLRISDAGRDVGIGLLVGAVCATAGAALMVWELLANIRASTPAPENSLP